MSASPYGNTFGRNSGQRGRMDNKNRKVSQGLNPKQYSDYVKKVGRFAIQKEDVHMQDEGEQEREEPYQTKTQVVEGNRLKRKRDKFQKMYAKEFVKEMDKKRAKQQVREFISQSKEQKLQREREQQQKQQQMKQQQEQEQKHQDAQ